MIFTIFNFDFRMFLFEACSASIATGATKLIGIPRLITHEKGSKSHKSITFIQHSLKIHSPFRPAGPLPNTTIVTLSDGCTL